MEGKLRDFLRNNGCRFARTGSREICAPAPMDTDEDYIVYAPKDISSVLTAFGYETRNRSDKYPDNDFISFRNKEINVILTFKEDFFERFVLATTVCKRLNLTEKRDRILVFQAILYGSNATN